MKIEFKKRHLKINLILGAIWLVLGILNIDYDGGNRWTDYGYLFISILYLALYFYQRQNNYLIIEGGIIKMNGLFGKKVNLTEIKSIRKFAGDYSLKTDKKDFTINTQMIDPNSLAELNTELEKLKVEWN